jgi:hypothetical protein
VPYQFLGEYTATSRANKITRLVHVPYQFLGEYTECDEFTAISTAAQEFTAISHALAVSQ